ncbi:MAG: leucine-rich repeat domain-containing protein [Saprospiraceae bacterium]
MNLGSNQIKDIDFLENLTNLHSLNLGYNQISDIDFIEKLHSTPFAQSME